MCSTCGCGRPDDAHDHDHPHDHDHDHGHGAVAPSVIQVERALLAENDRFASYNRGYFDGRRIRCLNMISAPGSGKTTLLEKTLGELLRRGTRCSVIEGDQKTDLDSQRIARTGARVTQIETGRACHLDAHQVQHALERLGPEDGSVLFIENVGNLICPTEFQLGEHERVVMLSVTEGSDKPAKYPLAFRTATAVVIGKIDLLPHVDFDLPGALRLIEGLSPRATVFQLSARTGEGMAAWLDWLTTP
jgi:hydrogenase nickel incorporation protein HypB